MPEESTIHPAILKTSDFSDRLSPMLVKELRQGLKGVSFMILFIAIQVILGVLILGHSFSSSYNNTGNDISTSVFICIGLATCVLQPLRAISAIGSEIKENTIDLMVITKLSAWRIVFGKWISLVSQSALIIAAVTPYLILRYFFGGMQLFAELMILFTIFLASAGFTAVFIGISSLPSLILRGLIGLGSAFFIGMGVVGLFGNSFGYRMVIELCSFQSPGMLSLYLLLVLGMIYSGWLALDYGAGSIAPISENRSTPRRLICLGIIVLLAIVIWVSDRDLSAAAPIIMLLLSVPISIITLTEHPFTTATVSVPFVRKGILGKIASYLLYPGWASGLNFVMILFALTLLSSLFYTANHSYSFYDDNIRQEMMTITCICFSCLVFPLLLTRIFFRNTHLLFVFYLGGVVATGILWLLVVAIAEETRSHGIYSAFCWLPPVQLNIFERSSTEGVAHLIALPTFFIYWVACFITSSNYWKHIRNNDQQAQGIIEAEKNLTESK
tara:strand:+ start:5804 stop:7303 length:1500 start_codon:yes stop_codon:yes gene_type:complete